MTIPSTFQFLQISPRSTLRSSPKPSGNFTPWISKFERIGPTNCPSRTHQYLGIMADKEASVYIVDVGSTMGDCHNGRTESDLDWSMQFVWDKIATTAQAQRKTWCVGVVGLRTEETVNDYVEDDGYANISILQDLGPVTLSDMKKLKPQLVPSDTESGDAMSAIIVATEMIVNFTKKNKWARNIYLVTDGKGGIDADDVDDIASRLNDVGVTLTVV